MTKSYPGGATFINAVTNHSYESADKQVISVGDRVYQLSKLEGLATPILREFNVEARLSDGRIHIKGSLTIETTTHNTEIKIAPHTVFKDAVALVKRRLADVKYQLEVELPGAKKALEKIWEDLGQDPASLAVGQGLNDEMEI